MSEQKLIVWPAPIRGLDKRTRGVHMSPLFATNIVNMRVNGSVLEKTFGYTQLGDDLVGCGNDITTFYDGVGNEWLIALTDKFIYAYDESDNEWDNITPNTELQDCEDKTDWVAGSSVTLADSTDSVIGTNSLKITRAAAVGQTLATATISATDLTSARSAVVSTDYNCLGLWIKGDANYAASSFKITLSETAGQSVDFTIADAITTSWQFVYVDGDFSSLNAVDTITISSLFASSTATAIYVDDIRAYRRFTISSADAFSLETLYDTASDWNNATALGITNGTDAPLCWDGAMACCEELFVDTGDFTSFNSVKAIAQLAGHAIFMNFNDGVQRARNVKWSTQGRGIYVAGEDDVWSSGTAGEMFLYDSKGKIIRGMQLSSNLVVYSDYSVTELFYASTPLIFDARTSLKEVGLFALKCVWGNQDFHVFIGTDRKIYLYAGSRNLVSVGQLVDDYFFNALYSDLHYEVGMFYNSVRKTLYIFYPTERFQPAQRSYLALNMLTDPPVWESGIWTCLPIAGTNYNRSSELYVDSNILSGVYCDDAVWGQVFCDEATLKTKQPVTAFITLEYSSGTATKVYTMSESSFSPVQLCSFDTSDYIDQEGTCRWDFRVTEVAISACKSRTPDEASAITLSYSTDEGSTWTSVYASDGLPYATLTADWSDLRFSLDVKCNSIRFRISAYYAAGDFRYAGLTMRVTRDSLSR